MINDALKILDRLYLWQITLICSIVLMMLGFTGHSLAGFDIIVGKEDLAIMAGIGFMAVSVLLRYAPPPDRRKNSSRPRVAISATQMALAAQFPDWIEFLTAAQTAVIPDHNLKSAEKNILINELRLELGTMQGLLERKVKDGEHFIRVIADKTRFIRDDS